MELRHLRYFVAVAETGSLTTAAGSRLHTAQPSLSRQIRDLESEVGVPLLARHPRGVDLTAAGRAFLVHARLALAQADAATEAARRAAAPRRGTLAVGFLTGQEIDWLPPVMRVLRDELASTDVVVSSGYSPDLADAVMRGRLDVAFMRPEAGTDLVYRVVAREPLLVVVPGDHRLASFAAVGPEDFAGETVLGVSNTAPVLRAVVVDYLERTGIATAGPDYEADNLAMAMSLIASTRSIGLLPALARHFLLPMTVSRPLRGEAPTIDLVIGYSRANTSPPLRFFLSRLDALTTQGPHRSTDTDVTREAPEA